MANNGFFRFLGAFLWGVIWSLLWLIFLVEPFSLFIYLEGSWIHSLELILVYAIGLFVSAAFLQKSFNRWFVYFLFLIPIGFYGLIWLGQPFLSAAETPICPSKNNNANIQVIGFPKTNMLLTFDRKNEHAVIYWRNKPWPFYKNKILPPAQWKSDFTSSNSPNPAGITCLQNLQKLKDD